MACITLTYIHKRGNQREEQITLSYLFLTFQVCLWCHSKGINITNVTKNNLESGLEFLTKLLNAFILYLQLAVQLHGTLELFHKYWIKWMFLISVPATQQGWDTAICKCVHETALILVHSIPAKPCLYIQEMWNLRPPTLESFEDFLVAKRFFKTE